MEIENKQCKGLKMLEKSGVEKYALIDIRGEPKEPTRHLIKMAPRESQNVPKQLLANIHVNKSGDITSAWFNSDGCEVCNTLMANSSFLISARHTEGYSIVYDFVAPNLDALRKIISTFEAQHLTFKILETGKFNPTRGALTQKQERALWLALKMGFFDFPRKITMLDLSKRVGVGLSTLSEILRRGTRRLVEEHFERA